MSKDMPEVFGITMRSSGKNCGERIGPDLRFRVLDVRFGETDPYRGLENMGAAAGEPWA